MISFQNQKDTTTRCSSLNMTGGITLRPSFGKNICIILSRSSQVALRKTPFGSLTTMKRSWKEGKKKKSIISQTRLFVARTIVKKLFIWPSPSICKLTLIIPVSNWLFPCARLITSPLVSAKVLRLQLNFTVWHNHACTYTKSSSSVIFRHVT